MKQRVSRRIVNLYAIRTTWLNRVVTIRVDKKGREGGGGGASVKVKS